MALAVRPSRRFTKLAPLGQGSMGVVFRVRDEETGAEVALKTLQRLTPDQCYRLKHEFRVLSGVLHPNLVELYELVVEDDTCFFTMELVEGMNLQQWAERHLQSSMAASLDAFGALVRQMVHGIAALHAAGRIHRDIKPSNVMIDGSGRVVLLDFGLSAELSQGAIRGTELGVFAGTPAYMAPEQVWGLPGPESDWYALGAVLFESLSGRLPFEGTREAVLSAKVQRHSPSLRAYAPAVPAQLDRLVAALLDPEASRRPTAEQSLEMLGSPISAVTMPSLPRPARDPEFVGREEEIRRLRACLEALGARGPVLVHVMGPSGVGKTRLVRQFLDRVALPASSLVLRGRCHPQESVPYKAVDGLIDGLSRWLTTLPESEVIPLLPRHLAALDRLFPVLQRAPAFVPARALAEDADPAEVRRQGAGALRELLARISDRHTLVLWIDDVQWSDLDSTALLRELLRPPDAPTLMLVLSYRSEERDRIGLVRTLSAQSPELGAKSVHEFRLGPLSRSETLTLAERLCPPTLCSGAQLAGIAEESEGFPFLVGEMARALRSGEGDQRADAAPSRMHLVDATRHRIDGLPAATRAVLEVVCVAGGPIDRRLALDVVGLGSRGRPTVTVLEQACLLRSTAEDVAIEVYHDRIREAVLATLDPEERAIRHRQIAEVLEAQANPDPQALFEHCLGAGDRLRAAGFAVRAADAAASALAFDRAAELFHQAIELDPQLAASPDVRRRHAEALSNAGRAADAGAAFAEASTVLERAGGDRHDVLWLRQRAFQQYLFGGRTDGRVLLQSVLAELGVALPSSRLGAILSSLRSRARLLLRGIDFLAVDRAAIPAARRVRLDAIWSAQLGLGYVDPVTSDALGVRCLLEALDAGDRSLVIHALGAEGTRLSSFGTPRFRAWSAKLIATARRLATESDNPHDTATSCSADGMAAYTETDFRRSVELCDTALALWRENCIGATWQTATTEIYCLSALVQLGRFDDVARRLPPLIADAEARADYYALNGLVLGLPSLLWLAEDRPAYAFDIATRALGRLSSDVPVVTRYLALLTFVGVELYEGRAAAAFDRMVAGLPDLRRAGVVRMAAPRLELVSLRARAALALAATSERRRRAALLRGASRDAERIERTRLPVAPAFAALLRAGIAHQRGNAAAARAGLEAAAAMFEGAGMAAHGLAARLRLHDLGGGANGAAAPQDAEDALRRLGVGAPRVMAAFLAPGFA